MPVFTSSIEVTADYPTIKPSLNLNFARSRALDPRITFTRASVGTYVGKDGLIKTAGKDEPRFDHDPDTLESLGLLIEEPRTNVYPNNHDPASGTSGTATKTTVQIVLPSGETGPALETDANDFAENYRNLTATSNTTPGYLTFYAKKKTSGSTGTLTVTLEGGNTGRTFGSFSINSDTWTKITHTHDWSSSNATLRRFDAYLQTANSSDSDTSFYLAFIQFEEASFPTSYIPTSGSNATRAVDQAYILGDNVPLGSGVDEYSFYVRGRLLNTDNIGGISRGLVGMGSSSANRIRIPHNNGSAVEIYSGGSLVAALNTGDIGTTERQIALAVKKDDFAMSMDGGTVQTDTSGNVPTFINDIALGCSTYDPAPLNYPSTSYIREFRIYPKRLTNAQLQLLTS